MAKITIKQNIEQLLKGINQDSALKFQNSQWPSPKEEEWRRTKLSKYNMSGFALLSDENKKHAEISVKTDLYDNYSLFIGKTQGREALIKINESSAEGIKIYEPAFPSEINEEVSSGVSKLAEYAAGHTDNKPGYLALSSFDDTLFLIIPDNLELDKPIVVEYESGPDGKSFLPNLFVITGKNVQVKIIQKIKSSKDSNVSGLLNVLCGRNSNIHTATAADSGSNSIIFINRFFELGSKVFLSDFQSCTGGDLIKARTEVNLSGVNADARLYGVIFAEDKTHVDMRTVQYHKEKDCFSQALIKSVVKDKGRSICQGLIEVEEDAALTDAYLANHNLVLNTGARADSIPSLKIRTNDVKCSHGSTTGKINEEQILYLTSRGISRDEARQMILEGFFGSVFDHLAMDIKSYCSPLVMNKLMRREMVS